MPKVIIGCLDSGKSIFAKKLNNEVEQYIYGLSIY